MTTNRGLSKYLTLRGGGNSWAQCAEVIAAWKRRALAEVPPLTLEFAPVLTCNADCVLCPYRRSRLDAGVRRHSGAYVQPDDVLVSSPATVRRVLEASREAGVRGVVWTGGGEPSLLSFLDEMCAFSASLGMDNALYTNGFLLGSDPSLAPRLLAPTTGMVFIRVSINAVSARAIQQHWGVRDPEEVLRQLPGLEALLRVRNESAGVYTTARRPLPSIQISTIIDHKNLNDLLAICQTVADIFGRCRRAAGEEDVMVVRPTVDHRRDEYSLHDHDESVIREIIRVCGQGGPGWGVLRDAGVPLRLGFGLDLVESGAVASYAEAVRHEYQQRECSWGHGVFLTAGPDGTLYPCTEMNANPTWAMGNLREQSVAEIYRSERRGDFLRLAQSQKWGPRMFQPFSRTTRLDRIARAIQAAELTDSDIEAIRQESIKSHRLLLN